MSDRPTASFVDHRRTVALVVTSYFAGSHADVAGTRLIRGYHWRGEHTDSRIRVASLYLDQRGDNQAASPRPDIGASIARDHGIPVFDSVGEALGCGRPGVNVDGVVIIGEHGDYEYNEFGQQLYPRRRLFDSAVAAMVAAGRVVPITVDKHLAYRYSDAYAMVRLAQRWDIPLLAGSSIPLTWRVPTGAEWPLAAPLSAAVAVGFGPVERYGFHILELLQSQTERRSAGETGVREVRALHGPAAAVAVTNGAVDLGLLDQALQALQLDTDQRDRARDDVSELFLITHQDGTTAAAINCSSQVRAFGFAATGPENSVAFAAWPAPRPHGHFTFLVRQIESLVLSRQAPYPVERTLLTTGILDAAMHSRHDGGLARPTPELAISYDAVDCVPDTGVMLEKPPGPMHGNAVAADPFTSVTEEPPTSQSATDE